jgi:hypothetical protein
MVCKGAARPDCENNQPIRLAHWQLLKQDCVHQAEYAVFAPIPSARERTATKVNPGERRNPRRAYPISPSMDH